MLLKDIIKNPDYIEKQWFKKDNDSVFSTLYTYKGNTMKILQIIHASRPWIGFSAPLALSPKSKEILWYFSKHSFSIEMDKRPRAQSGRVH